MCCSETERFALTLTRVFLQNHSCDAVFRKHQGRKTELRRGKRIGPNDRIVVWHQPKSRPKGLSKEEFDALTKSLTLREVHYYICIAGFRTKQVTLITTLLDDEAYPAKDLLKIYEWRWQVELDLKHIKITLGMDVLRGQPKSEVGSRKSEVTPCLKAGAWDKELLFLARSCLEIILSAFSMNKFRGLYLFSLLPTSDFRLPTFFGQTPDMVRKEIYVHLLGYNEFRTVMWDAGTTHGVHPLRLSLQGASQHLHSFKEQLACSGKRKRQRLYQTLLELIAHKPVPERYGRNEPRVRKRRPLSYPVMQSARAELRRQLKAA